jgi:hypothetical protein
MNKEHWFDDLPVLGALPPEQAAARLRQVGEEAAATALEEAAAEAGEVSFARGFRWPFRNRPWQHTAHAFGYLAPAPPGAGMLTIESAGAIAADETLRNARLRITLDHLRVADYPGEGEHRILFDFYAQNQVPGTVEHLHFNATFRAREGEGVAAVGHPLFVGLNVGGEGVAFKGFTVNVQNSDDEAFLGFLESDTFRQGLRLATTVQPAIGLFSETALALTRSIATRNRNVAVQDFYLGLDFSSIASRARLAEGSYLAVQIPETLQTVWRWDEWVYDRAVGRVVNKEDPTKLVPYNYLVLGVSRYDGD